MSRLLFGVEWTYRGKNTYARVGEVTLCVYESARTRGEWIASVQQGALLARRHDYKSQRRAMVGAIELASLVGGYWRERKGG